MSKVKMKTNRAAAKRFKVTGSGRIKRNHAYHGHLFESKSPKRKRNLLLKFGSVKGIREASEQELTAVNGMTRSTAQKLKEYL